MRTRRGWAGDNRGQSLVEVALALPLLLLIVLGIVDIGRLYTYKAATTNAAREAAMFAARDPQARAEGVDTIQSLDGGGGVDISGICQRARDELGAGTPPSGQSPCTFAPITVSCMRGGSPCGDESRAIRIYQNDGAGGAEVSVTVTYDVSLLTTYLVSRAFNLNPHPVSSTATFVGLGQ